jgi:hypothetical protein
VDHIETPKFERHPYRGPLNHLPIDGDKVLAIQQLIGILDGLSIDPAADSHQFEPFKVTANAARIGPSGTGHGSGDSTLSRSHVR